MRCDPVRVDAFVVVHEERPLAGGRIEQRVAGAGYVARADIQDLERARDIEIPETLRHPAVGTVVGDDHLHLRAFGRMGAIDGRKQIDKRLASEAGDQDRDAGGSNGVGTGNGVSRLDGHGVNSRIL